jgi:SSS family solute:Na+ symporter
MLISTVDLVVVFAYLVGIVGLGIWAGFCRRRGGEVSHYFLAGNTLKWPIIGLAMFAVNISTDIFKCWKPRTTDHQLVVIGKITTVVATIVAIVLSPIFGHYSTIIEGLNKLISYIAPPITAVFLFGVFWKKASGKAAFITLVVGAVLGVFTFFVDWNRSAGWLVDVLQYVKPLHWFLLGFWVKNFMMTAFYLLVMCGVVMIVASLRYPEPLKEEAKVLVWESRREPLRGEAQGRALGNYRILAVVVLVTFLVLYYVFR